MNNPSKVISGILKHESKRNTYKIALVRAINDVALEYPHLPLTSSGVAIPLRLLAEFWFAYYWAFVDTDFPVRQGHDATDFAFRDELSRFRQIWQSDYGQNNPAEGFYVKNEMSIARKRNSYPPEILTLYESCLVKAKKSLQQPIRYAGTGEYKLFQKPEKLKDMPYASPIPSAETDDLCLFVPIELWAAFQELSLWIEALCIHEWCLFTETVRQSSEAIEKGLVYTLLTARPDNRRPLTWERNQVDLLLMEGYEFRCPWTKKQIKLGVAYDIDHIVPIAVRPINELWNLVPADPNFNSHTKRDRLPSNGYLEQATPIFVQTYSQYLYSKNLKTVLESDSKKRFGLVSSSNFSLQLAERTSEFIRSVAEYRNLAQF